MTSQQVTDDSGSLGKAALRGSVITVLGHGLSTLIRFGANLIITRLLLPEHFGVMAIVNVFIVALHLFSDIGVGPNIIQSQRGDDPVFLNTAWTVQVLRGVLLWLFACALAWPMSRFYEMPELQVLLPVAGVNAVIGGLESTRLFTLNRSLSFLRITLLELVTQLAGVVAMVLAAWLLRSVWALVISATISTAVRTVLSHTALPGHRNSFAWDAQARRSLIEFGRWILVSTALTFLANQNDRLLLGKLVSAVALGVYSIGANIAALPTQVISMVSGRVFFPVVARSMRAADHDPGLIRTSRVKLIAVLAPVIALSVAMAPAAMRILYDERYRDAGMITSFLSIGAWFGTISSSYGVVLLAAARPKVLSLATAMKAVSIAALMWPVATRYGTAGAALLVALSELPFLVVAQLGARREGVVTLLADLGISVAAAALVGIYLGLYYLLLGAAGSSVLALVVVVIVALALTAVVAKKVRLLS